MFTEKSSFKRARLKDSLFSVYTYKSSFLCTLRATLYVKIIIVAKVNGADRSITQGFSLNA